MKNLTLFAILFVSVTVFAQQDGSTGPSVTKTTPVLKVDAQPNNSFVAPNSNTRSTENKDNASGQATAPSTNGAPTTNEGTKNNNSTLQTASPSSNNGRREQPKISNSKQ